MNDTSFIFILGSGRCGTKALVKMLQGTPDMEVHHEYCRYAYQREAVLNAVGYMSDVAMKYVLEEIFTSAAYYSEAHQFLDSSHKLVWVSRLLREMYPKAKFIHLVRDGRKVAASFYYKLQIHDDKAHAKLMRWFNNYKKYPLPPPSEKYWWLPFDGDRFERIVNHWVMSNRYVMDAVGDVAHFVRLEDISTQKDTLKSFLDFVEVPYSETYWKAIQKPDHAYVPINYELTEEQRGKLAPMLPMLEYFGYNTKGKEEDVKYYKL